MDNVASPSPAGGWGGHPAPSPSGVDVSLKPVDDYISSIMKTWGVRGAQLAVAVHGRLVLLRAYTWAEPDYGTIGLTDRFRVGSMTKPITATAIMRAIEIKLFADGLETNFQNLTKLKAPDGSSLEGPQVANFDTVRLWHLLSHVGGFKEASPHRALNYTYSSILKYFQQQNLDYHFPFVKGIVASYAASRQDQFPNSPGKQYSYANIGFSFLGIALERATNRSYRDFVYEQVFLPCGVPDERIAISNGSRNAGEVRHHGPVYTDIDELNENNPMTYSAHGFNGTARDAYEGFAFAAVDYVRVLAAFQTEGKPIFSSKETMDTMFQEVIPTQENVRGILRGWIRLTIPSQLFGLPWHNGLGSGGTGVAIYSDGLAFVLVMNTSVFALGGNETRKLYSLLSTISNWPERDLFAAYMTG